MFPENTCAQEVWVKSQCCILSMNRACPFAGFPPLEPQILNISGISPLITSINLDPS